VEGHATVMLDQDCEAVAQSQSCFEEVGPLTYGSVPKIETTRYIALLSRRHVRASFLLLG
jgi:hypothetical protein